MTQLATAPLRVAGVKHAWRRPRRRFRWRMWLGILLVGGLVWGAGTRIPCGPADGTALEGMTAPQAARLAARPASPRRLRLGTFNIHGGKGRDGVRDLERIADCLAGLDFVGLNEVRSTAPWEDSADQAEELGERLGLPWLFAPTECRWGRDYFGNGVLTRLAVEHWQRIPLAREHGKSYRNLVHLCVLHEGQRIQVVVTHVDRSDDRERARQLRVAGDFFLSLAPPAVLMGDMNTDASEPALARLLAAPDVYDPLYDVLGKSAPRRIDWLLTRGLRTVDAGIVDVGASDHPHVWAEVEVP